MLKHNKHYLETSINNPEPLLDDYYSQTDVGLVITNSPSQSNYLMDSNRDLITCISGFEYLHFNLKKDKHDPDIQKCIRDVKDILKRKEEKNGGIDINYSPFCQFFSVLNLNFSLYLSLKEDEKSEILYSVLIKYVENRHKVYKSHGYSDIVLQVMSDSYSHKGKGADAIKKFEKLLAPYNYTHVKTLAETNTVQDWFFLPDHGDDKLFTKFLDAKNIIFQAQQNEQGKRPDFVMQHNGEIILGEMKNMKESGGGQDKQLVEIINFIRYSERSSHIHYLTFLDGALFEKIVNGQSGKFKKQWDDINQCLDNNSSNYFVNTAGLVEILLDLNS